MKSRLPSLFATGYIPLSTIPSLTGAEIAANGDIGAYLQSLYTFGVSAAAGLAVIMVIWGGIEYITSASGEGKGGGKEKITSAILGLLLALGSYIILNTINPELLTLKFFVEELKVEETPKFTSPSFGAVEAQKASDRAKEIDQDMNNSAEILKNAEQNLGGLGDKNKLQ